MWQEYEILKKKIVDETPGQYDLKIKLILEAIEDELDEHNESEGLV
jgi:hypothetical protein